MHISIRKNLILPLVLFFSVLFSESSFAGTLENMERERAILIETFLSLELNETQRSERLETSKKRLIDLERLVLRDKSLLGSNKATVRNAFNSYDLSFLVHSSLERNKDVFEHWLQEIGVSTSSLMKARIGRR